MGNNRSKPFLKRINVITCNLEQKISTKSFLGLCFFTEQGTMAEWNTFHYRIFSRKARRMYKRNVLDVAVTDAVSVFECFST